MLKYFDHLIGMFAFLLNYKFSLHIVEISITLAPKAIREARKAITCPFVACIAEKMARQKMFVIIAIVLANQHCFRWLVIHIYNT